MNQWRAAAIAVVLITATACSSDGGDPAPGKPASTTALSTSASPSPTPTPSESASITAAKAAYQHFMTASFVAQRNPMSASFKQINLVAVDPALGDLEKTLVFFQANNFAFRGTPPKQRLGKANDHPGSRPYPSVSFTDCPTVSSSWLPYNLGTGKPAKTVPSKVPPPFPTAVVVIFYKNRWTVQKAETDRARTCTP